MKISKQLLSILAVFGAVLAGSAGITTDAHAVGVSYYGTTGWNTYGTQYVYSNSWTSNSSNNTVTINGWQDTYSSSSQANITYEVVASTSFGWVNNWTSWSCPGNYPKNGTWYGHQFTNIANGLTLKIRSSNNAVLSTDMAGNAYQS